MRTFVTNCYTSVMGFKKGHKLSGSRKDKPNKVTQAVKEVFLEVFNELQKDPKESLLTWAKENKTDYYKLTQKLIPTALEATIKVKKLGKDLEDEQYE